MNSSFYAMLSRMKYINRWSLMRNTRCENLSEHTYDVALLAHALAILTNRRFGGNVDAGRCVLMALYHDAPEILTGDMPTPVKYQNPEIRGAYKQVEEIAGQRLIELLPADIRDEYAAFLLPSEENSVEQQLVKAADKLSALVKCVEEQRQGNHEFDSARTATEKLLRDMKLPAADCFLDEFFPAYEMTLDEIGL